MLSALRLDGASVGDRAIGSSLIPHIVQVHGDESLIGITGAIDEDEEDEEDEEDDEEPELAF